MAGVFPTAPSDGFFATSLSIHSVTCETFKDAFWSHWPHAFQSRGAPPSASSPCCISHAGLKPVCSSEGSQRQEERICSDFSGHVDKSELQERNMRAVCDKSEQSVWNSPVLCGMLLHVLTSWIPSCSPLQFISLWFVEVFKHPLCQITAAPERCPRCYLESPWNESFSWSPLILN